MRISGAVLLDQRAPVEVTAGITNSIQAGGRFRVVDLHLWSIGPGYRAAIISVRTPDPCDRGDIEALVPDDLGIAHLTVEIHGPESEE